MIASPISKLTPWRWSGLRWLSLFRVFLIALLLLVDHPAQAQAPAMPVVEYLRLQVPSGIRFAWLKAEQEIWQPWLCRQKGFLGRDIYWDQDKEEAVLLIRWSNREDWRAIPAQEVTLIQRRFEAEVKQTLGLIDNPFPLVYAGELEPLQAPCLPSD